MSQRSVEHATFSLERTFAVPPEQVFAAFGSIEAKGSWFIGPDAWRQTDYKFDFRIGGKEHLSGGPPGGPVYTFDALYQDIVDDQRIVYSYEMYMNDTRISVSIATLEFYAENEGTHLIVTEQGVYLDGHDTSDTRQRGTDDLLDKLGRALTPTTTP